MFFNLLIVSKSLAEISTLIGAVLELRSNANLPCLVNLALSLFHIHLSFFFENLEHTCQLDDFYNTFMVPF